MSRSDRSKRKKRQRTQIQKFVKNSPGEKLKRSNGENPNLPNPYDLERHALLIYDAQRDGRLTEVKEEFRSTRVAEREGFAWRVLNESHTFFEAHCNPNAFDSLSVGEELTVIKDPHTRNDIYLNGSMGIPEGLVQKNDGTVLFHQKPGFDLETYRRGKEG